MNTNTNASTSTIVLFQYSSGANSRRFRAICGYGRARTAISNDPAALGQLWLQARLARPYAASTNIARCRADLGATTAGKTHPNPQGLRGRTLEETVKIDLYPNATM